MRAEIAVCVVLFQFWASGQQAHGVTVKVLSVNDGATCRVRRDNGRHYRLCVFGIDAPESDQPYGQDAGDVLRALKVVRDIEVKLTVASTYGRRVARIYDDNYSVSEAMVAEGWAWHYDRYKTGAERTGSRKQRKTRGRVEPGSGRWVPTR